MVGYSVDEYGAVGDGVTDDGPAIQSAIDACTAITPNNTRGGIVYVPDGFVCITNQSLELGYGVRLCGSARGASKIKAGSGFPSNTYMVRLGKTADPIVFGCRVENIALDANGKTGSTCVYSTVANEQSGVFNSILTGFRAYGCNFDTGSSVVCISATEVYAAGAGATAGIRFSASGSNEASRCSIVAGGSSLVTDGILVSGGNVQITSCHIEGAVDAVHYSGSSYGTVIGLTGPSVSGNVTNMVHLGGGSKDVCVLSLSRDTATYTLVDDYTGGKFTDAFIRCYTPYEVIVGRCRILSNSGSPEGVVTGLVGSLFLRSDGGAGTTLYVKQSGSGKTGWVAK